MCCKDVDVVVSSNECEHGVPSHSLPWPCMTCEVQIEQMSRFIDQCSVNNVFHPTPNSLCLSRTFRIKYELIDGEFEYCSLQLL